MDADNRVVLNCGGIRHEVYKVDQRKLMYSIYVHLVLTLEISFLSIEEKTMSFSRS